MKFLKVLSLTLAFSASFANAQNYDSTGGTRLWAPNPNPGVNTPATVPVPGYGSLAEGAVSNSWEVQTATGCFPSWTYGICVVRNGGPGASAYDALRGWKSTCPGNTYSMTTGVRDTTTGSVCGGD